MNIKLISELIDTLNELIDVLNHARNYPDLTPEISCGLSYFLGLSVGIREVLKNQEKN